MLWTLILNWRFETEVPLLMSPLHIYSKDFKKEKTGHRLSVPTSTNSTTATTITTRPPMPLPLSVTNQHPKHHHPNTRVHSEQR